MGLFSIRAAAFLPPWTPSPRLPPPFEMRRRVSCLLLSLILAAAAVLALWFPHLLWPERDGIHGSPRQPQHGDAGTGTPGAGPRAASSLVAHAPPCASPPGGRSRPGGATPPGTRAPPGSSPPGARARPGGATPLGARAPPGRASPPGAGVRAPPGRTSLSPGSRAPPGGASLPGARTGGAPPPAPGAHAPAPPARASPQGASAPPGGASPGARAPPGGASRPGARTRPGGVSPPSSHGGGKGAVPQAQGKAKAAQEHGGSGVAGAPLSPPPVNRAEEKKATNIMLFIGCVYSLFCFCGPIITYWSTASSIQATDVFYGWWDLFAAALGAFAWLLFGIAQIHTEDGQIVGTATVVVNAFGVAFYATYIVVKLANAGRMGTKSCVAVMLGFLGAYIGVIVLAVFTPIKKDSQEAVIISFIAFLLQLLSQIIPLLTVCPLLCSMICPPDIEQRSPHINTRKLIVFSRVNNFALSLFWASYCIMRFEHDYFAMANVVSAGMSLMNMVLHLVYALRPHRVDPAPAAPAAPAAS